MRSLRKIFIKVVGTVSLFLLFMGYRTYSEVSGHVEQLQAHANQGACTPKVPCRIEGLMYVSCRILTNQSIMWPFFYSQTLDEELEGRVSAPEGCKAKVVEYVRKRAK